MIPLFAFSEIIRVPDDYSSIQAGLNEATTGDTVLVAPGTYYENIGWPSVDGITLTSSGDSSNTYIVGEREASILRFYGNFVITNSTRVENVTITNGASTRGGGIVCFRSSPTFSNVQVCYNNSIGNISESGGGGIYLNEANVLITNSSIRNNEMTCNFRDSGGGGIYSKNSSIVISNTVVEGNSFFGDDDSYNCGGGGLYVENRNGQQVTIDNSKFSNNYSQTDGMFCGGGSIYAFSSITITDSEIIKSDANISNGIGGGGGIYLGGDGNQVLSNLVISGNSVTGWGIQSGGGGMLIASSPTIINSKIGNNLCDLEPMLSGGGGVFCGFDSSPSFIKTVFAQNTAAQGSAIFRTDAYESNAVYNYLTFDNNEVIEYESYDEYNLYNNDNDNLHVTNSNFRSVHSMEVLNNTNIAMVLDSCWWGDPSGPYHETLNPNGLGDTIVGPVVLESWLTTPDTVAYPLSPENLEIVVDPPYWIGFSWDASPSSDVEGYRINFDYDESGYPYAYYLDVRNVTEIELLDVIIDTIWYFAITAYDEGGDESWFSNEVVVDFTQLEIESSEDVLPTQYEFVSTYPNPFNPSLTAKINLPDPSNLTVLAFNLLGQKVATISDGHFGAGEHSFVFDGSNLSSGVYLIQAVVPGKMNQVKKVVLMK